MMAAEFKHHVHRAEDVDEKENKPSKQAILFEEDADSRDSGISMTSCGGAPEATDFSKVAESTRQALSDCSNFVPKVYNSSVSSSRSSSFYHHDTPRKSKSVFYDSFDHSQYEKKSHVERCLDNHRKRSSASMSPVASLQDRKRSRNLSVVAPQSDKICRYSGAMKHDNPFGDDDDEDDVFVHRDTTTFAAPAPRSAASLWNLAKANVLNKSDDSQNGSSQQDTQPKPMRTMSVGVIDTDSSLPSMLEVKYTLPSVERPQKASQAYRSISAITLLSEFQRLGPQFYETYVIIDCRYPYEFRGGHVRGAINLYKRHEIKELFFPDGSVGNFEKRIPIFYCEYSQKRGPTMANAVRSIDRVRNELRYPHVEYPEMYLLDHGYKSLWNRRECRQICEPCNYVPMDHKHFTSQLKTARLERHRSNASVKPNGDPDLDEKPSIRTRSCARRTSSVLSLQSKFSQSSSNLSITSQMISARASSTAGDDVFFVEPPQKSVSAFDIHNISDEIDCDFSLRNATSAISSCSSIHQSQDHVVQLGMKVVSPDFPCRAELTPPATSSSQQYLPMGLDEEHNLNTPRLCLDFSSISDTD